MIRTEKEYQAIVERIEELLKFPENIENQYEECHYPVKKPALADVVKLRMAERGLNQKRLSELLGVSTSRVSEYLTGKSEPTLNLQGKSVSDCTSIPESLPPTPIPPAGYRQYVSGGRECFFPCNIPAGS